MAPRSSNRREAGTRPDVPYLQQPLLEALDARTILDAQRPQSRELGLEPAQRDERRPIDLALVQP